MPPPPFVILSEPRCMRGERRISPYVQRDEILRPFATQNDKNGGDRESRPSDKRRVTVGQPLRGCVSERGNKKARPEGGPHGDERVSMLHLLVSGPDGANHFSRSSSR